MMVGQDTNALSHPHSTSCVTTDDFSFPLIMKVVHTKNFRFAQPVDEVTHTMDVVKAQNQIPTTSSILEKLFNAQNQFSQVTTMRYVKIKTSVLHRASRSID